MKGIYYDLNLYKAVLKKIGLARKFSMIQYSNRWPEPTIHHPNQVKVKTRLGGICAGDIHQIDVSLPYSASIIAKKENPFQMGHELIGEVVETGNEVSSVKIGDHVIFSPMIHCDAYGFEPCECCKEGHYSTCQAIAGFGDGSSLEEDYGGEGEFGGFSGGGFSEYFVAFEKQLTPISTDVPEDIAVLAEPLTIGIHAALRKFPKDDETVLVIGCGIIGLMTIAALRALKSRSRIISIARYQFQADAAKNLGADIVIVEKDMNIVYERIADLTNGILVKPALGKRIIYGGSGPSVVYDTVGSDSSIDDALRLVRCNGTIVLIGMAFGVTKRTEWALQIYKEIDVLGSMNSGLEEWNGEKIDAFSLAARFLEENPDKFTGLVTHQFPIEKYKDAFNLAMNKSRSKAIKVVFNFLN